MDHVINLNATIGISEYVKAELEIGDLIYRQEFDRHQVEYLKTKAESELIFIFIFLQIYTECFLHQNMRKIVELEFKPPRESIYIKWLKKEKRYVPAKIDNFSSLFFIPIPSHIQQLVDIIKDRFEKISDIRNLFAHGHKVAEWSDSDGNAGSTRAKSLLTETQLNQTIAEINELGLAWGSLLDGILPQCKALTGVGSFKFENI